MHSDYRLIREIKKKNDRNSANELVSRYYDEIYIYAYKQLQEKELAMDMTQDIFIAVLNGLHSYDEKKASFRTWLYRLASNKITDFYRSRFYKQKLLEAGPVETDYIGTNDNQEEMIINKMTNEKMIQDVMILISGYNNEWIRIFQMKIFEELSFKELSKELGISENTVKTRYYTMIKMLKKELV